MNAVGEAFVQKDTPKHLFGLVQRQLGIGSATLGFVKGCQEGDAGAVISLAPPWPAESSRVR